MASAKEVAARVESALMLVDLGLTTIEQIRTYFANQGDDEAVLASLNAEYDRRIARRTQTPPSRVE